MALLLSIPADQLAAEQGSALDTVADQLGPGAVVLGVLIGIGLFGIQLYGNAIALFDFVAERLPGRPPTRVVLRAGRGRVLLARPGRADATQIALAYSGMRGAMAQLEVTVSDSAESTAISLGDPGSEETVEAGAERLEIEVIEVDESLVHLALRTSMTISTTPSTTCSVRASPTACSPRMTMPVWRDGCCGRERPARPRPPGSSAGPRRRRGRGCRRWPRPAGRAPSTVAGTWRRWQFGADAGSTPSFGPGSGRRMSPRHSRRKPAGRSIAC